MILNNFILFRPLIFYIRFVLCPIESKVYPLAEEYLLDAASGNAGSLHYGGGGGDAKKHSGQWDDWDEEEEEALSTNIDSF
ncbi:MAG: hypothetical protein ACFNOO_08265 [Segatella oulorum]